jgi:hypothetical protein
VVVIVAVVVVVKVMLVVVVKVMVVNKVMVVVMALSKHPSTCAHVHDRSNALILLNPF